MTYFVNFISVIVIPYPDMVHYTSYLLPIRNGEKNETWNCRTT